jgi:hypothetical protein
METEWEQNGGGDWEAIAARVARSHGIDRFGLTRQRLNVLVALGQVGAVSRGRMADYAGCGIEELEKFVMPALLIATVDDPAMVAVTNKGYAITWRGIAELDRRGIPHRGAEVVADGHEKLDFGTWDSDDFGTEEQAVAKMLPAPKKRSNSPPPYLPAMSPPAAPFLPPPVVPSPPITVPTMTPPAPRTLTDILRDMAERL